MHTRIEKNIAPLIKLLEFVLMIECDMKLNCFRTFLARLFGCYDDALTTHTQYRSSEIDTFYLAYLTY